MTASSDAASFSCELSSCELISCERGREQGFTLLELLVALALAAILSLCISTVGTQAQRVYDLTTAKVEVYQKFRYALKDMKVSLENMTPTSDLEFFVDSTSGGRGQNGHWDEGEEIKPPNPNLEGGTAKYNEGALVIEREYEVKNEFSVASTHANYSIYFKAPVEIEDVTPDH
ncbi:MAG: prepilin-type N-terminal cleavage/methylation domain-containing protein, partial [Planctomycetota bacterium]